MTERTGKKPETFDSFIEYIRSVDVPQDFMADRADGPPQFRPSLEFDEVCIDDYPQLASLARNRVEGQRVVTEEEALSLYRTYWRFVDENQLSERERLFLRYLLDTYGNGRPHAEEP